MMPSGEILKVHAAGSLPSVITISPEAVDDRYLPGLDTHSKLTFVRSASPSIVRNVARFRSPPVIVVICDKTADLPLPSTVTNNPVLFSDSIDTYDASSTFATPGMITQSVSC